MRKIKEVLRLRFGLGLRQDQISRSCSIGQATVHRYLERAAAVGLSWPLPDDCDDQRLNELLFPARPIWPPVKLRPTADFAQIHSQLQMHRHLTLQLVWEEYRETHPDGYGYSRFCELYQRWSRNQDVVLRQEHRAGEKMFVDWAGDTVPIYDRETGESTPASIFVAVLGASTYTFARAAQSQGLAYWIDCHVNAFEFFHGVTRLLVPDNPRTGVSRACRYEPDLNRTYHEMAQHYGIAVLPARPRKPRDKAKVENAVGIVERWILAALRHRRFFAVAELNEAIDGLLERLNHRRFRKRDGTRASLFETIDRPALQPLPAQRYLLAEWKTVRANIDYHVEIDRHYYSVPYQLAGQQLEARYTISTVELFHGGKRVASHGRSSTAYRHTTTAEHMPKSHQAHLEWSPSRLIHWGETVGVATAEVIRTTLAQKACRDGFSVAHKRTPELFRELAVAHVDGSIGRVLLKLSRIDVIVLDDFAMAPLKDNERRDFLEICDDRYQRRSMILTSQMPIAHWHEQIGDPSIADSILGRVVHNSYRIELSGESMRKKRGQKPDEN